MDAFCSIANADILILGIQIHPLLLKINNFVNLVICSSLDDAEYAMLDKDYSDNENDDDDSDAEMDSDEGDNSNAEGDDSEISDNDAAEDIVEDLNLADI